MSVESAKNMFSDGFEFILISEQKSEELKQIGTVLPPLHDRDPERISISKCRGRYLHH